MRTFGVAAAGLLAGLVLGFLLFSEVLGRLVVHRQSGHEISAGMAAIIGFGPVIFAVAGAVLAVVIDRRRDGQNR